MAGRNHEFSVASRCELLPYLLTLPLGLSRKEAKDLLRFRAVSVRRIASVRHDTQLQPGDVVTIAAGKQIPAASIEHPGIVYLDDAVVVVEKRAGLLSMGSESEKERTAHRILNEHLKALTKSTLQQAFIVHRLDRETSGLMMFASKSGACRWPFKRIGRTSRRSILLSSKARPQNPKERCATVWSRASRCGCIGSSAAACSRSLTIES